MSPEITVVDQKKAFHIKWQSEVVDPFALFSKVEKQLNKEKLEYTYEMNNTSFEFTVNKKVN